jgi:hypothetical protein
MSITTQTPTTATRTRPPTTAPHTSSAPRQALWKHGIVAAAAASVVTTALASLASADGVSFATEPHGAGIPIAGFAELTMLFSLIGVGLAAVLARRARRPRTTFTRTAVALAVLSVVPDLTFGFDAPSAVTLVSLHTIAAVIVIPTLAGRLARIR